MPASLLQRYIAPLLPWALLLVALALVVNQVERPAMLMRVWVPWAQTGALAIVMTAIILTGGIDLSVGSMVALCMMVQGVLWSQFDVPLPLAVSAAIVTGVACGAFNGGLVAVGLSPLVATLATMAFFRGLAMLVSNAQRISDFPDELLDWDKLAGLPTPFWLLLFVAVVAYVIVHHTRLGRWCYAIGDNRLAATFASVPVRRAEWLLYTASGLVAGMVAVLYTADRGSATPDALRGIELQAIACVVVGGTSITGGRGAIWRTLLGLAVIANLDTGLKFLGTSVSSITAESRLVIIGVLLITVAIWNERVAASRLALRQH